MLCRRCIGLVAASLLLAACDSYKPTEFPTQPGEIGDEPGLFSGEDGKFVILGPSSRSGNDEDQATGESDNALPPAEPPAGYKPIEP